MSKDKNRSQDRHKNAKMVRIRSEFVGPLEQLVSRYASDGTQLVNDALREKLEREGFWPPKPPESK